MGGVRLTHFAHVRLLRYSYVTLKRLWGKNRLFCVYLSQNEMESYKRESHYYLLTVIKNYNSFFTTKCNTKFISNCDRNNRGTTSAMTIANCDCKIPWYKHWPNHRIMITNNDERWLVLNIQNFWVRHQSQKFESNITRNRATSYRPKLFRLFLGFTITAFIAALTTSLSTS